jgi:TetR/AcrR family transcriptional repressor of nem operon
VLRQIEAFFLKCVETGQTDGTIMRSLPPAMRAQNLLGVLMGIRVLARVRPEPTLTEGVVAPALVLLRFSAAAGQSMSQQDVIARRVRLD